MSPWKTCQAATELRRDADRPGHGQSVRWTQCQSLYGLLCAMCAQSSDGHRWQCDRPPAAVCLGRLKPQAFLCLFERLHDPNGASREVKLEELIGEIGASGFSIVGQPAYRDRFIYLNAIKS
jgi:hypothetical protein